MKGAKGVSEKLFGVWTERRTEAGLLKLEPGASHTVAGRGVYLVLSGSGECAGTPLQQYTTVYLETGETTTLRASETMELLHYGLARPLGYGGGGPHLRRGNAGGRIARRSLVAMHLIRRGVLSGLGVSAAGFAGRHPAARPRRRFLPGQDAHGDRRLCARAAASTPRRGWWRGISCASSRASPGSSSRTWKGAAGIIAANHLARRAAPDGLTLAVPGRSWFVEGHREKSGRNVRPDTARLCRQPGRGEFDDLHPVEHRRSRVSTISRIAPKTLSFGSLGSTTPTGMIPTMLAANGVPIKVIFGYVSTARVLLALEQGEIDGVFTVEDSFARRQDLIKNKVVIPILQNKPTLPGIPLVRDVLPPSQLPL